MNPLAHFNLTETLPGCMIGRTVVGTGGPLVTARSPIDAAVLATIPQADAAVVGRAVDAAQEAFLQWRLVPAPVRGEFVRRVGNALRAHKEALAALVTLEAGKIVQEGLGEVQEMIDIADFAVGLSRQLHGLTIASERPGHRMMEQWHPLGPVGVISAFNFPVAVWAWNAMLAWVCGDSVVWKPSEKTPLTALACQKIVTQVLAEMPDVPAGISSVVIGDAQHAGAPLVEDARLPLISATGSVPMGRAVAQRVAARLGRSLLELGGNNGLILTPSADEALALRAVVFSAFGTCGQRCTTLRRLIVHNSIRDAFTRRVEEAAAQMQVGDPRQDGVLLGPLIDEAAYDAMAKALAAAKAHGGQVTGGDRVTAGVPGGVYVKPAVVRIDAAAPVLRTETFAPILYVVGYDDLDEAIRIHNDVPQGLSSAILTTDVREAERFLSPAGSDCGIANVNIGTSGAEIGGAFGGEKETGGGRESGSDAWKAYMRRATNTINYSSDLPLAQGIKFPI